MNKVIIMGNLGQDPEVKYTPSGAAVATLSVATNETWTDKSGEKKEEVEWHRVVVWNKTAENCGKYLAKGRTVLVEGRNKTRSYEDKDGVKRYVTEIHASSVQFVGGNQSGGARPPHPADAPSQAANQARDRAAQGGQSYHGGGAVYGEGGVGQGAPHGAVHNPGYDDIPF